MVFRITHISNVPWILEHGLQCASSALLDPGFVSIGSDDLIPKRRRHLVPIPPGGSFSDYIPFYFTPRTPMLYNITTGRGEGVVKRSPSELAVLVSSLHVLREHGVACVFTDRHAFLATARFSADPRDVAWLRWDDIRASDFARNPEDPGKFEQYQAEAMAHRYVPTAALLGIACNDEEGTSTIKLEVAGRGLSLPVAHRPGWLV